MHRPRPRHFPFGNFTLIHSPSRIPIVSLDSFSSFSSYPFCFPEVSTYITSSAISTIFQIHPLPTYPKSHLPFIFPFLFCFPSSLYFLFANFFPSIHSIHHITHPSHTQRPLHLIPLFSQRFLFPLSHHVTNNPVQDRCSQDIYILDSRIIKNKKTRCLIQVTRKALETPRPNLTGTYDITPTTES